MFDMTGFDLALYLQGKPEAYKIFIDRKLCEHRKLFFNNGCSHGEVQDGDEMFC